MMQDHSDHGADSMKATDESRLGKDSLVSLMHHDLSDLAYINEFGWDHPNKNNIP